MPCILGMVNMAEIFGVPLKTLEDIDKLTKGIELGKYEAVWSGMTSEKCKVVMDAIFAMWGAFVAANPSGTCASGSVNSSSLGSMTKDTLDLVDSMQIDESPIVHSVSIQEKPSSYVGAVGGSKPKPRLEDVLENGPWMIHNSLIILKKWSMNTRLCKEELTCIPLWVKIHDVPIQVFSEGGLSIIAYQIGKPIMLIRIPPRCALRSGFTIETVNIEYEWKPPRCDLSTADVPKKGATKKNLPLKASVPPTKEGNITVSNSYATLDDESAKEVENVYDELANLLNSTKTGESSSTFTVAAG
ncbi:zinc knuckle CX2CX4HX4C containing protein [Tanacetum coccineum]|uniref:Zinc knuckle CX2CX4HX4C containing protein n=1 Tax=Tanacetum coccineum TaxID=301880 RepID=A0ABQ5E7H2_9ASTR